MNTISGGMLAVDAPRSCASRSRRSWWTDSSREMRSHDRPTTTIAFGLPSCGLGGSPKLGAHPRGRTAVTDLVSPPLVDQLVAAGLARRTLRLA